MEIITLRKQRNAMLIVLIVVGCICSAAIAREYPVTVTKVMDGDTVRADIDLGFQTAIIQESIRFAGINAPEVHTKNLLEKEAGFAVRDYVTELIGTNPVTLMTGEKERGKFGRPLGELMVGELNLSDHLLGLGYAHGYEGGKKVPFTDSELNHIIEELK